MKVYEDELVSFREPSEKDLKYIAKHIRQADREEIRAFADTTPLKGIKWSIEDSTESYVALIDDIPVAVFGLTLDSFTCNEGEDINTAGIWLVGVSSLLKHSKLLTKISSKFIQHWLDEYGILFISIWSKNTKHIKWIERLGFKNIGTDYEVVTKKKDRFLTYVLSEENYR